MASRCVWQIYVQHKSKVRGSLPLINYEPKEQGFISDKLPMTKDKGCKFVKYTVVAMVIWYILWVCHTSMLHGLSTMKTNYIYVLYFFVDSSSWTDIEFIEVTMVLNVIDDFKFQQVIHCNININKNLCFSYSCLLGFYIIKPIPWSCGTKL